MGVDIGLLADGLHGGFRLQSVVSSGRHGLDILYRPTLCATEGHWVWSARMLLLFSFGGSPEAPAHCDSVRCSVGIHVYSFCIQNSTIHI